MKLMDADVLYDIIKQHEYILSDRCNSTDYGMFTIGIKQAIDESPTVNAVPVVRCKDCKHRDPEDKFCDCGCWHTPFITNDDDFCSYGERKEVQ